MYNIPLYYYAQTLKYAKIRNINFRTYILFMAKWKKNFTELISTHEVGTVNIQMH